MDLVNVLVAFFIRLILILYGTIHDKLMEVKYTDIDYTVFTEAAEHVVAGRSPYLKSTYKYTPVLAFLLTPNILLHPLFGKVLFCVCDIIVIIVMEKLLKKMQCTKYVSTILVLACWTFNPFTMTISSRGNAESFQMLLVLFSIFYVMERKCILAGIFYGFSVHFKLYPVIYVLPFLLYMGNGPDTLPKGKKTLKSIIISTVSSMDNILFGLMSFTVFCLLGGFMYYLYGMEFVENTYLYHFSRKDIQHNFSFYFYIMRLADESSWISVIKTVAFLPQLITVVRFGLRYYEQLPLACFLQTFAFVSLNKVCTSQYFIWYIGLFPLAFPSLRISWKRVSVMVAFWLFGQGVWLFLAYLLEFRKFDIAVYVWLASIMFCIINMIILFNLTRYAESNRYELKRTESEKEK